MGATLRICFIGDSFVNGTGDPACLGWTGRVCRAAWELGHDVTYYNLGVRRETSSDIRARWPGEVRSRLPAGIAGAVVFSFGVNDTTLENGSPRIPFDVTLENAEAILVDAKRTHRVLFVGPPPVAGEREQNDRVGALCAALQRTALSVAVPYLPVFEQLNGNPVWRGEAADNDGAHPHAGGYEALASLVRAWPAWRLLFE